MMFEVRDDVLEATASADRDPNMSEFVGLLPLIPSGIKVIVALLDCPSGTLRLVIPVDPLRRLRDASEEQATIACAVLYGQISVNGDQLLRKEYLRKFFAIEAPVIGRPGTRGCLASAASSAWICAGAGAGITCGL